MSQTTAIPANISIQQAELMQQAGELNPYYPDANDLSGGLPINLDSLRDGPPGSKPFYPYSTLIRYAIKGSPTGKLLLEDIYYAIESRFPYFRTAPAGWKNSVRHNLSLNPCFVKVARPLTDRGKGSYWTVDDNVDPRTGVHRVRNKKGKKPKLPTDKTSEPPTIVPGFSDGNDFDAQRTFDDQGNFATPQLETDETASPTFAQQVYPPTYDPSYQMLGMRYAPVPLEMLVAEDRLPTDEHGNINWRMTWMKELAALQLHTENQNKNNVEQEWYRTMFYRVRMGLMSPWDPTSIMQLSAAAAAQHEDQPHEE